MLLMNRDWDLLSRLSNIQRRYIKWEAKRMEKARCLNAQSATNTRKI